MSLKITEKIQFKNCSTSENYTEIVIEYVHVILIFFKFFFLFFVIADFVQQIKNILPLSDKSLQPYPLIIPIKRLAWVA